MAFPTRIAISGLIADLQFSNNDNVFLVTPSLFDASVTVKPSGFKTSSRKISPWVSRLSIYDHNISPK